MKNFGLEISPDTLYHKLGMRTNASETVYEITGKCTKVFKELKRSGENPHATHTRISLVNAHTTPN